MRRLIPFLIFLLILSCAQKEKKSEGEWRYLYDLGLSAFYAKNYSEAIAHLYRATKIAPKEPKVWNALGLTYMEVEEFKKAEEAFRMALTADPTYSEAKMNLGILFYRAKDYRRAVKVLEEAVSDELFDKKHVAFYHLAKVYKELGDRKKYIEFLRKATAYNPRFIEAQLELGSAYMDMKKYGMAEKVYTSLISNNFTMPNIYLSLAKVYYDTGRLEKAKEAIKIVLEDKQTNNLQRAQAYELLSKILVEEQRRSFLREEEKKKREEKVRERSEKEVSVKQPEEQQGRGTYGIQIAAFSTLNRAESLRDKLTKKGLKDIRIIESSGIFKVIYGSFPSREDAKNELERLKQMEIYGFIVEVE